MVVLLVFVAGSCRYSVVLLSCQAPYNVAIHDSIVSLFLSVIVDGKHVTSKLTRGIDANPNPYPRLDLFLHRTAVLGRPSLRFGELTPSV